MLIQVLIADNGDGESAVKVAYKFKEELQKGTIYTSLGYGNADAIVFLYRQ